MFPACLRFTALLAAILLASCDSLIYDDQGDCDYYVHFKYDYNMKWADAFAHEVNRVTLYILDSDGNIVWRKTESGPALATEGYAMRVDLQPGQYTLMAWCGVENPTSFHIPEAATGNGLTATLQRTFESDGRAHVRGEVDRLYYGRLDNVSFNSDTYHFTVPLMKNTNNIRATLQQLSGEPVPEGMFTYTIEDDNGSLDWDNSVLKSDKLVYHAWHVGRGTAEIEDAPSAAATRTQTSYSTEVAEFTVSRLMEDHAPDARLIIRRTDNGKEVVNINLVDALILGKGYYNRNISDQEYLDRQDDYVLTFFLDEGLRWVETHVNIESWHVVYQEIHL